MKAPGPGTTSPKPADIQPLQASTIAYTYAYTLQVPKTALAALIRRHQAACVAAGSDVCQLLDSQLDTDDDSARATLNLRATPTWLAQFRDHLEGEAHEAGGRILQNTVTAEDLGRSLVDTQATIRAETALRNRLQALLETHPGKLSDLLDLEKELATAQGQLDATQSELAALMGRVQMSKLTLTYTTPSSPAKFANPLVSSISSAEFTFLSSLGALVTLIAVLLPWVLVVTVGGVAAFAVRRKLNTLRRPHKTKPASPLDLPPTV